MKPTICILAMLCPILSMCQPKALRTGDTLPASSIRYIESNIRHPSPLIILDFWATWCTACINGFGKLESLQQQFPQLKVLLINAASTGDDEQKISAFIAKRFPKGLPFPALIKDTIFKQFFPHELLPHYVWIYKGAVSAITGSDELTPTNIEKLLDSKPPLVRQKIDQDVSRPLFSNPDIPVTAIQQYAVFLKGRHPGLGSGNHLRRSGSLVHGHAITNSSLLYIYKMIAGKLIPGFNDKRFLLQCTDSSQLFPPPGAKEKEKWEQQQLCTIDYIVPPEQAGNLYHFMLDFINKTSGWHGKIIIQSQQVFRLQALSQFAAVSTKDRFINKLHDKQNPYIQNGSIINLLDWCNKQTWLTHPVISSLPFTQKITLKFPAGINSLSTLNAALKPYNLLISQEQEPISIFLLSQAPAGNHSAPRIPASE